MLPSRLSALYPNAQTQSHPPSRIPRAKQSGLERNAKTEINASHGAVHHTKNLAEIRLADDAALTTRNALTHVLTFDVTPGGRVYGTHYLGLDVHNPTSIDKTMCYQRHKSEPNVLTLTRAKSVFLSKNSRSFALDAISAKDPNELKKQVHAGTEPMEVSIVLRSTDHGDPNNNHVRSAKKIVTPKKTLLPASLDIQDFVDKTSPILDKVTQSAPLFSRCHELQSNIAKITENINLLKAFRQNFNSYIDHLSQISSSDLDKKTLAGETYMHQAVRHLGTIEGSTGRLSIDNFKGPLSARLYSLKNEENSAVSALSIAINTEYSSEESRLQSDVNTNLTELSTLQKDAGFDVVDQHGVTFDSKIKNLDGQDIKCSFYVAVKQKPDLTFYIPTFFSSIATEKSGEIPPALDAENMDTFLSDMRALQGLTHPFSDHSTTSLDTTQAKLDTCIARVTSLLDAYAKCPMSQESPGIIISLMMIKKTYVEQRHALLAEQPATSLTQNSTIPLTHGAQKNSGPLCDDTVPSHTKSRLPKKRPDPHANFKQQTSLRFIKELTAPGTIKFFKREEPPIAAIFNEMMNLSYVLTTMRTTFALEAADSVSKSGLALYFLQRRMKDMASPAKNPPAEMPKGEKAPSEFKVIRSTSKKIGEIATLLSSIDHEMTKRDCPQLVDAIAAISKIRNMFIEHIGEVATITSSGPAIKREALTYPASAPPSPIPERVKDRGTFYDFFDSGSNQDSTQYGMQINPMTGRTVRQETSRQQWDSQTHAFRVEDQLREKQSRQNEKTYTAQAVAVSAGIATSNKQQNLLTRIKQFQSQITQVRVVSTPDAAPLNSFLSRITAHTLSGGTLQRLESLCDKVDVILDLQNAATEQMFTQCEQRITQRPAALNQGPPAYAGQGHREEVNKLMQQMIEEVDMEYAQRLERLCPNAPQFEPNGIQDALSGTRRHVKAQSGSNRHRGSKIPQAIG